jgi:hypothetical protein
MIEACRTCDDEETREYAELLSRPLKPFCVRGSEAVWLCKFRIKETGKWDRYQYLIKETRAANPAWKDARVRRHVMTTYFGLENVVEERHHFYTLTSILNPLGDSALPYGPDILALARRMHRGTPTKLELKMEHDAKAAIAAFRALPAKASAEDTVEWVMAHERLFMLRQHPGDPDQAPDVTLSAQDMTGAPCRKAVTMLQEALAAPKEFWRAMLSEQKKGVMKAATAAVDDMEEASDEEMERLSNG